MKKTFCLFIAVLFVLSAGFAAADGEMCASPYTGGTRSADSLEALFPDAVPDGDAVLLNGGLIFACKTGRTLTGGEIAAAAEKGAAFVAFENETGGVVCVSGIDALLPFAAVTVRMEPAPDMPLPFETVKAGETVRITVETDTGEIPPAELWFFRTAPIYKEGSVMACFLGSPDKEAEAEYLLPEGAAAGLWKTPFTENGIYMLVEEPYY